MPLSNNQNLATSSVQAVLKSQRKGHKGRWLLLILVLVGLGAAYYYFQYLQNPELPKPIYQTEALKPGDLTTTLLATGNLQPLKQVDIGTEISGKVIEVKVAAGAEVKEGEVLAKLDTKQQEDAIDKAKAALTAAKASAAQANTQVTQAEVKILQTEASFKQAKAHIAQAEAQTDQAQAQVAQQGSQIQQELANVESAKVALQDSQAQFARLQKLHTETQGKLPSTQELETARANWQKAINQEKASRASLSSAQRQVQGSSANVRSTQANIEAHQANLESAKAAIESAKAERLSALAGLESAEANVASAEAALRTEINNLSKTIIKSSLDGVVLKQLIEPGQTVFATSPSPVLFTLVDSLTRMRLRVFVDETGIGQVAKDQEASFSVDAWPKRSYAAKITDIGINSELKDNIVTYPVDLQINNEDLSLKPGMTATATIKTQTVKNVLKVPNAALYYTPTPSLTEGSEPMPDGTPLPPPPSAKPLQIPVEPEPEEAVETDMTQVWLLKDDAPLAVKVKTGITNGKYTEVTELETQQLVEGAVIILGEEELFGAGDVPPSF